MSEIPADPFPSGKLPCQEQLSRFRRLATHLKRFLSRYSCEPQTRERFLQREALKNELWALEDRCSQALQLSVRETMLSRMTEEMNLLNREFRALESRIHTYIREATT